MNTEPSWKDQYNLEIQHAEKARKENNEGKARVCARRAAGIAVGEYFRRLGAPLDTPSAYDIIRHLIATPGVPAQVKQVAEHLVLRVNKDHNLPVKVDLIAETRWLMHNLLEN